MNKEILEVVKREMDNQVGLYEYDKKRGVGVVIDLTTSTGYCEIFCGYIKEYRLDANVPQDLKNSTMQSWKEAAEDIIQELAEIGEKFTLASLSHKGFIIDNFIKED
jgi:hypothetical protein